MELLQHRVSHNSSGYTQEETFPLQNGEMPWQGVGVGVNSYSITREDPDHGV